MQHSDPLTAQSLGCLGELPSAKKGRFVQDVALYLGAADIR